MLNLMLRTTIFWRVLDKASKFCNCFKNTIKNKSTKNNRAKVSHNTPQDGMIFTNRRVFVKRAYHFCLQEFLIVQERQKTVLIDIVKRAYSVFYCWFLCNFSGFCTLFRFCQKGVCTFLFRIFIKYFHRRCVWVSGFQICKKKIKRAYLAVIRPFDKDTAIY